LSASCWSTAGTGTVEVGGLSTWQALEIVPGTSGLNLLGGDLVEISPQYDPSGNTALSAANLLFEMLCAPSGHPDGALASSINERIARATGFETLATPSQGFG
jgi:hypothetical protein